MVVRNLKRWYLIDRTLSRYNRRNEPLTKQQLAILLAIYFRGLKFCFVKTYNIVAHLKEHNKSIRPDVLSRQLKILLRIGLIEKRIVRRTFIYQVTVYGELELKEIEQMSRTCRLNKDIYQKSVKKSSISSPSKK